jgi:hypothetical protein
MKQDFGPSQRDRRPQTLGSAFMPDPTVDPTVTHQRTVADVP